MPALLTRMSMPPKERIAASAIAATCASSLTSQSTSSAAPTLAPEAPLQARPRPGDRHHDRRALRREPLDDRAADALRTAGDDRDLVPQLHLYPAPPSATEPSRSGDAAHAEVLDLQELLDAVVRALAAEAGLLDAAERRDLGRDEAGVDADDAVLERLGDAPDAADVAARRSRRRGRTRCRWPCAIASSSVSKRKSGATGPKVSSRATVISGVDVGEDGRLEEACRRARGACRRPAPCAPLPTASAMCSSTFSTAAVVDQRAAADARLQCRCRPSASRPSPASFSAKAS